MKFPLLILFFLLISFCTSAQDTITKNDIRSASKLASLSFTEAEIDQMLPLVQGRARNYVKMHSFDLPNSVPFVFSFNPVLPGM